MLSTQSVLAKFTRHYLLALSVIALLVTLSYLLLNQQFRLQKSYGQAIDTAGAQRILLQRTALLAKQHLTLLRQGDYDRELEAAIHASANTMSSNQLTLNQYKFQLDHVPEDINALLDHEGGLNFRVDDFIKRVKHIATTHSAFALEPDDLAVLSFDPESNIRLSGLRLSDRRRVL